MQDSGFRIQVVAITCILHPASCILGSGGSVETAKGKTHEEINRLANRIDTFEKYNYPHARLLADLATRVARRLGLTPQDTHAITEAALLHDIGLQSMSPAYHATPGLLSYEERMDLWRHAVIGEQEMAKRDATRHAQL